MSNKLIQSMLEPLASRFQSIEDRLSNLENKKECRKEITDTERIDFIKKSLYDLVHYQDGWSMVEDYHSDENIRYNTPRQAIDAAMREKNE